MSDQMRQVQRTLGVGGDGYFGPRTEFAIRWSLMSDGERREALYAAEQKILELQERLEATPEATDV